MTKEEFINIAEQSTDRVDMLQKMGKTYSEQNVQEYIRKPRISFGITIDEMFSHFLTPTMSKVIYMQHVSGSISNDDVLAKMGYPKTKENRIKYVIDLGRKHGFTTTDIQKMFQSGSSAVGT